MAARRCGLCDIWYPNEPKYVTCPVHSDEKTSWAMNAEPDSNWEGRAALILARMIGSAEHIPPIVPVSVTYDAEGLAWVSSWELIQSGLHTRMAGGEIIEIPDATARPADHPCECLWEIMGYSASRRAYWVRQLKVETYVPE